MACLWDEQESESLKDLGVTLKAEVILSGRLTWAQLSCLWPLLSPWLMLHDGYLVGAGDRIAAWSGALGAGSPLCLLGSDLVM